LDQLFPYGPHLEQELNQHLQSSKTSSSSLLSSNELESVVVRWRGLPGWTASAMVEYMNDSTIGLRSALDAIRNPSISIVIILAGTNDIGSVTSSMFGSRNSDLEEGNNIEDVRRVMDPIVRLHKACLECVGDSGRKDMQTLAVGIPGSAWQERNSNAARLCADVNDALRQFAASEERVTFTDFPFLYQCDDVKWSSDGLHLSPEGYQTLGKCLAQCVKEMCMEKV
jgi:hypothetical protein